MSLNIYMIREEVPEDIVLIDVNDLFFDVSTLLTNSEIEQRILSTIDKAEYRTSTTFKGRTKGMDYLDKSALSTGTKTLLNILQHKDTCFNIAECGDNALNFIPFITEGHILWTMPVMAYIGDDKCDIQFRGRQYTSMRNFLNYVYYEILK